MSSPGEVGDVSDRWPAPPIAGARHAGSRNAADRLAAARRLERSGRVASAIAEYECAIVAAELSENHNVLAESLRLLAVLRHQQDDTLSARVLCERSRDVALGIGDQLLAAAALNTMGGLDLMTGSLDSAEREFLESLERGSSDLALCARAEQNLGILANIRGRHDEAMSRYARSLESYRTCGDRHGCAIAYHNLAMVSADRGQFEEAARYFEMSLAIADVEGDVYLRAAGLVNSAEVDVSCQRYENARQKIEDALACFDKLEAHGLRSGAHRVLGMIQRETGRPELAAQQFHSAIQLAVGAGSMLNEAEASRELATLHRMNGRNHDALRMLTIALRLFRRLDARTEMVDVGAKVAELESGYLSVVRAWGQSLESTNSRSFGHCERVAQVAVAIARAMRLTDHEETTILVGAYLHDVGMMRVPRHILDKAGPLTRAEMDVVRRHPIFGAELLASIDFPWDIKPIIRWHHERIDGTGYPDRIAGDALPLSVQIVGIAEAYDAMTNPRPYRAALSVRSAAYEISTALGRWSEPVIDAFLRVVT
jgi:putative nucleotidyltransferase with HDIG domain